MDPIETEVVPPATETVHNTHALAVRQSQAVGAALSHKEISERLAFIAAVMRDNMKEGTDYGKIPGCGDKPGLFQPGAQKLSMTFQLNPAVQREEITDYPNYHRGYRLTVRVTNGSKFADGVGECSTLESKYRYKSADRLCPSCGKPTIIKGKAEYGGGWICFAKKGGCGAKYEDKDPVIVGQNTGKVENDAAPDHWNTVRKMAFKRAFVHAIINATNTSELWSQDLEDLASNGVVNGDEEPAKAAPQRATPRAKPTAPAQSQPAAQKPAPAPAQQPARAPAAAAAPAAGRKPAAPGQPLPAHSALVTTMRNLLGSPDAEKGFVRFIQANKNRQGVFLLMPNEGLADLRDTDLYALTQSYGEVKPIIAEWLAINPEPASSSPFGGPEAPPFETVAQGAESEHDDGDLGPSRPAAFVAHEPEGEPEVENEDPGALKEAGEIAAVTTKEGTSARGTWKNYRVMINGKAFTTFDKKTGELAMSLKGQRAIIVYEETAKGNNIIRLNHLA